MNAPVQIQMPLFDLDLLRTLVAIAETGSFSGAATAVFRTPSAISMQVKKMEEIIDRPLFIRDSRSVTLTADGAYLLEHARRMLALNREAVARFIEPDLQGVVRLGAPDDVAERFLPNMLRRFADSHPGVSVNVVVDNSDRMIEMYDAGDLDMTLITCDAGFEGDHQAEIMLREQLVWAVRQGGIAAEQSPMPISVWEEGCVWRKAGTEGLDAQGRAWRIAFQSAHITGQRAAILADLAIAPVPKSALGGEIIEAPAKHGLPDLPEYALGLIWGKNKNAVVAAAADHLRASFAQK